MGLAERLPSSRLIGEGLPTSPKPATARSPNQPPPSGRHPVRSSFFAAVEPLREKFFITGPDNSLLASGWRGP
jgi:hypothetical protein